MIEYFYVIVCSVFLNSEEKGSVFDCVKGSLVNFSTFDTLKKYENV